MCHPASLVLVHAGPRVLRGETPPVPNVARGVENEPGAQDCDRVLAGTLGSGQTESHSVIADGLPPDAPGRTVRGWSRLEVTPASGSTNDWRKYSAAVVESGGADRVAAAIAAMRAADWTAGAAQQLCRAMIPGTAMRLEVDETGEQREAALVVLTTPEGAAAVAAGWKDWYADRAAVLDPWLRASETAKASEAARIERRKLADARRLAAVTARHDAAAPWRQAVREDSPIRLADGSELPSPAELNDNGEDRDRVRATALARLLIAWPFGLFPPIVERSGETAALSVAAAWRDQSLPDADRLERFAAADQSELDALRDDDGGACAAIAFKAGYTNRIAIGRGETMADAILHAVQVADDWRIVGCEAVELLTAHPLADDDAGAWSAAVTDPDNDHRETWRLALANTSGEYDYNGDLQDTSADEPETPHLDTDAMSDARFVGSAPVRLVRHSIDDAPGAGWSWVGEIHGPACWDGGSRTILDSLAVDDSQDDGLPAQWYGPDRDDDAAPVAALYALALDCYHGLNTSADEAWELIDDPDAEFTLSDVDASGESVRVYVETAAVRSAVVEQAIRNAVGTYGVTREDFAAALGII